MPVRAYFKAAFAVVKAMCADHGEEVPKEVAQRRMEVCKACSVFVEKTQTCGFIEHNGNTLGCGCYMVVLSQLRSGHCWLRDNAPLSGLGWPDSLL